ncbi:MAG: hypothetical protein AAFO29_00765, partial [Actinomycetota bacterium]
LERGLDRRDSITSALEVDPANPFAGRLHQRVADLSVPDAGRAIRLPFRWRPLAIGLALLVAAVVLAIVRNPADDDRDRLAAERAAVVAAAEDVQEQADALRDGELADDPAIAELADELDALAEELADQRDLDQARQRLEEASAELASQTDSATLAQRAASLGLSRTLESRPLTPSAGGATPSEQLAQLADDAAGLSEEDLAELAERLAELAETQQAGDPETAEALSAAAEAAAAGDQAGLAAALGDASASAGAASSAAQAGLANDAAAADLDQLADDLADAAEGQGEGAGQGQGQGEGQGQGQGQGSGQGQGEGQGQGQGSGEGEGQGQGSGEGEGQGQGQGQGQSGAASGTVGGASASGQDPSATGGAGQVGQDGQGDADESATHPDAEVVVPEAGASDRLSASAQATGDNTSADPTRVDGATTSGQATVPVRDVVTDYRSRAVAALDDLRLAPSETDAVQSYFDRLAEATGAN